MRKLILKYLLPSEWVEALKGNKRLLGVISLLLWIAIYAVPTVKPEWAIVAEYARRVQDFLSGIGISLDNELLVAGAGLTLIGAIDWIYDHVISDILIRLLKGLEKPVSKKLEKPEA